MPFYSIGLQVYLRRDSNSNLWSPYRPPNHFVTSTVFLTLLISFQVRGGFKMASAGGNQLQEEAFPDGLLRVGELGLHLGDRLRTEPDLSRATRES